MTTPNKCPWDSEENTYEHKILDANVSLLAARHYIEELEETNEKLGEPIDPTDLTTLDGAILFALDHLAMLEVEGFKHNG